MHAKVHISDVTNAFTSLIIAERFKHSSTLQYVVTSQNTCKIGSQTGPLSRQEKRML